MRLRRSRRLAVPVERQSPGAPDAKKLQLISFMAAYNSWQREIEVPPAERTADIDLVQIWLDENPRRRLTQFQRDTLHGYGIEVVEDRS